MNKLFFEGGMLKIEVSEQVTETRSKFLNETYWFPKVWDKKRANVLILITESESTMMLIIDIAKRCGFEMSQDVEDFYGYKKLRLKEATEKAKRVEECKRIITQAENKANNGCGWCEHLEYVMRHTEERNGEQVIIPGKHFCKYVGKACRYRAFDVEYEFESRKEARALGEKQEFYAPPYPIAGCAYMQDVERAWEILNKEKERDV